MFEQGALFGVNDNAPTPGMRRSAAESISPVRKSAPAAGVTVRSASKAEYIDFTNDSKPLKTDSRMIIAATGIATGRDAQSAIRLTTDRDWDEKR